MTKLFVICGHGAGDPGACANGYQEAERVRVLGKKIKELGGSNVTLGDVNRDYYADKGISSLNIPKDTQIVELHMDSATATARGGHVIIQSGIGGADKYDTALADFISSVLPGRSNKLVERNDLQNPYLAYQKGYGYRLLECGFISNKDDLNYFNSHINDLAKGILKCFGIGVSESKPSKPSKKSIDEIAKEVIDGKWGNGTDREKKLKAAGYDYNAVQKRVNELMVASKPKPKMTARQFALEVWNEGKHGSGATREAEAKKLGVDYNEAQRLINILASGGKI